MKFCHHRPHSWICTLLGVLMLLLTCMHSAIPVCFCCTWSFCRHALDAVPIDDPRPISFSLLYTVKSRQSAPISSTLRVGRGGWASPTCRIQCYMKKYSPYENCSCISYTGQRSRARSHTDPTKRRVCAIPGQELHTVAYISNGVEHASAVQYGITDCDGVIVRGYNQSRP